MRVSRLQFVVWMSACGVLCLSTALANQNQDEANAAKKHEEIPAVAKATTIGESKETSCWATESALYVKLNPPRKSGEIRLPRLANIVSKVHWLGHADAPLNVHPEPTHWVVKFDKAPEKATRLSSSWIPLPHCLIRSMSLRRLRSLHHVARSFRDDSRRHAPIRASAAQEHRRLLEQ